MVAASKLIDFELMQQPPNYPNSLTLPLSLYPLGSSINRYAFFFLIVPSLSIEYREIGNA